MKGQQKQAETLKSLRQQSVSPTKLSLIRRPKKMVGAYKHILYNNKGAKT